MRHVIIGFGPRPLRSPRRPAALGKHRGNELERVYFARAMRVKRFAAFRGGGRGGGKGEEKGAKRVTPTRRRIVCKNLVKSLTKRQSD